MYTNDEADRSLRQRNFYLAVYLLPIALVVASCAGVYWASANHYLTKTDSSYGYVMSLTPAALLFGFNRRNWLKMPDGSFYHIKGADTTPGRSLNEPLNYEAEYFFSKTEKATTLVAGLILIGASVWLKWKGSKTILLPIGIGMGGIFMSYVGLKGLLDKNAKLKIAKTGLWTTKLGFVNWDNISFADVVEDKSGKQVQKYLHIRLKGTKFEEADQPDERLLLSELKDNDTVEMVINNSITNYNNGKKKAG